MRTKPIIAGAVLIAVLLLITIVFIAARQPSKAITVHHVNSLQYEGRVIAVFEITNHTTGSCFVGYRASVEVRSGPVWKKCLEVRGYNSNPVLSANAFGSPTFEWTNLPTGSVLRLRFLAQKELVGLDGLFTRLELHYLKHNKVSLNPFSKSDHVLSLAPIQIISDEFVEPDSNHTEK